MGDLLRLAGTVKRLSRRLHNAAKRLKSRSKGVYGAFRVLKPVAAVLGPQFRRSPDRVEIDLTYACTLACYNCNRSVRQAPSREAVTLEQIDRFLKESVEKGVRWRRIRLLGGEPTIHSEFGAIVERLLEYKREQSPAMNLAVHTNGHGPRVLRALEQIPEGVEIVNTNKTSNDNDFYSFNRAPRDTGLGRFVDYSMGCRVPTECGVGLTPYGYYPCAIAGGIDRVLGLDLGRKSLPADSDRMAKELEALCQWCGNFLHGGYNKGGKAVDGEVMSESWKKAYEEFRKNRPTLSTY